MSDTPDEPSEEQPLSERLLDLLVFLPTGLVVTVAEELPRLAERGRERLGMQVNSARSVGRFAVRAGRKELKKRSEGVRHSAGTVARPATTVPTSTPPTAPANPSRLRTIPFPPPHGVDADTSEAPVPAVAPTAVRKVDAHVPDVASLAIPGFDTLSASQVVQRLDGLNRTELVSVRAYETSGRSRRTILSRVDQLLDERS
jgi:hypothetical protein